MDGLYHSHRSKGAFLTSRAAGASHMVVAALAGPFHGAGAAHRFARTLLRCALAGRVALHLLDDGISDPDGVESGTGVTDRG